MSGRILSVFVPVLAVAAWIAGFLSVPKGDGVWARMIVGNLALSIVFLLAACANLVCYRRSA